MTDIILLIHNVRSTHNVGALLRTCDGFGVRRVIISGYSPYPKLEYDERLPHLYERQTKQIEKTSLGAEKYLDIEHSTAPPLQSLKDNGYKIVGLEQSPSSTLLQNYTVPSKVALLLGEEVYGIDKSLQSECDDIIEIKMSGHKESFNVSVAAGIALYQLTI